MSSRGGGNYGNRGGPYGGGGGGGSYRGDYQPRRGGRGRGNWRGGNRGRGANMQPVSRPQHNTTEDRLDSLIIRIGEKSNQSLQNNLLVLSEVLNRELETHRHKILATMGACIHELPHKTTIYTTLVGLINAKNFDFGQCFVEYIVHVLFKSFLEDNEFVKIRVTVRFVADLVNCNVVSSDSVIDMYHEFLKVADETDIPQERSDLYLECVMASLPWVGLELSQSRSKELDEIMRRLDTYMAHRNTSYTQCMNVWRDDAHNTSPAQVESMEALWTQVKTLENKRWDDQAIYRPYLSFDHELTEATPHTIPSISIPVHMHGTSIYPLRSVVFRLWEESDIPRDLPQLQKNDDIERYVIDQQVRELIITFNGSRKDCVKNMIAIPYGDRFPLEYIVVEVIFAELFRLPTPDFRACTQCVGENVYKVIRLLSKYEDASTGLGEMAAKLVDAFRERQSSDQIAKMLDEQVTPELLRSEGTSAIGFDAESSEEEQLVCTSATCVWAWMA
ncbi:hypothetical protein SARC_06906 [Sphaeroforma arctica JP610]|uniref:MIF4G domain-containing protein n=1 Tax=Sphaeroforma arctica JP610 TaxID=667725 RepID=A0A0L0FVT3_9EUKA|nr:hypothetical protein SARC_06906 [Sphaeroforma arctica JP610]KNC80749.1 hypothetical protein SARC_06906 [Sphaeroforma arctica JP610]|eukprot:XP_014154651.1 hypothetical protein SARC_06906 [Sphaeroforma arctica JP610]